MSTVFKDTHGCEYQVVTPEVADRGGYASLFVKAKTYRAQRVTPGVEDPHAAETRYPPAQPTTPSKTIVLVTHIPLTSSLQDAPPWPEAAALETVLRNVALRRRVRHPLLRTMIDAFFTDQQLCGAPVPSTSSSNGGGESVERTGSSAAAVRAREGAHRTPSPTALIVLEEFCEGCTLADYADVVFSGRLTCSDATLQRDAAAVVYVLASFSQHLHTSTPVVYHSLPLDCVHLDVNQGTLRVRLPLTAVSLSTEHDGVDGSDFFAPDGCAAPPFGRANGLGALCAPEVCGVYGFGDREVAAAPRLEGDGVSTSADVWALGALLLELCALNHRELAAAALHGERERAAVLRRHVAKPETLLPPDVHPTVAQLVRACLDSVPEHRPSLSAVLKGAAFTTNRSCSCLEQNRAIIGIAEAVLQIQRNEAASSAPHTIRLSDGSADACLADLTLLGQSWSTPDAFRDALVSGGAPPRRTHASFGRSASASGEESEAGFSLAAVTQQTLQDVTRLHALYCDLDTTATISSSSNVAASSGAANVAGNRALRARVRRSRQLPRDLTGTVDIMDELTEHFAQLEKMVPESSVRLMELLVEGFSTSAADLDAVSSGLVVADALLHASAADVTAPTAGHELPSLGSSLTHDDTSLISEVEGPGAGFNVADTLRVMPSMPAQVYSSDRAANTTAVLYNSWLRKQKKKHLKMDGY